MNARLSMAGQILAVSAVVCALALVEAGPLVIDLEVTAQDIEEVLAIARGPEAGRAGFHAPYVFKGLPPVETIEVITERRRLALIAAERIAIGDPLFTRGTIRAEEALRPWRRRVAIAVKFAFPVNNSYTLAPPIDITLSGGPATRLDLHSETLFALPATNPSQPVPVVGARGEAVFDATAIGQATRTVMVKLGDREVVRQPIDFSVIE
jgi:hypothetical protein